MGFAPRRPFSASGGCTVVTPDPHTHSPGCIGWGLESRLSDTQRRTKPLSSGDRAARGPRRLCSLPTWVPVPATPWETPSPSLRPLSLVHLGQDDSGRKDRKPGCRDRGMVVLLRWSGGLPGPDFFLSWASPLHRGVATTHCRLSGTGAHPLAGGPAWGTGLGSLPGQGLVPTGLAGGVRCLQLFSAASQPGVRGSVPPRLSWQDSGPAADTGGWEASPEP